MASKFTHHDEVLALLLTDDVMATRLALQLREYVFPADHQGEVAQPLLAFVHEWQKAPKEHAFALVEDTYHPYLHDLVTLAKNVHRDYVAARFDQFLREGAIRKTAFKALEAINMADWEAAEGCFREYGRGRSTTFDPGIRLRDEALRDLMREDPDAVTYRTGVGPLDHAHVGPGPKQMLVFIAPPKRGKSWYLINQGKTSCVDRKTVLHISLEMNNRQVAKRYVQNVLSLTKREVQDGVPITTLALDNLGRLQAINADRVVRPRMSVALFDRANEFFARSRLYIKEFPTGALTVADLRAYLDTMEQVERVIPDVLVVDYIDLMKLASDNLRIDTGVLYREMRGIAMERGIALVTASQSGRKSADQRWVRDTDVAEDWSKIMTADTVLTYSQTPEERRMNLGRIFVSNARDEGDKWGLLMSQQYGMGQFCLDAVRLHDDKSYWRMVDGVAPGEEEEEGE